MEDNKKSHQSTTSSDWREAVRKRPAMYIGSTGIYGFVHILKEFFASFYSFIDSSKMIEAENLSFEITGSQSGIFLLDKIKTKIPSNINEILHLVGFDFAVLNALSEAYEFTLFDKTENEILKQIYREGILRDGEADDKKFTAESAQIKFKLDSSIWNDFEINPISVSDVIKTLAFLNKNKTFEIKYSVDNKPCRIIYRFKHGLKEMIDARKFTGWNLTLFDTHIEKDFDDFSVELAFAFWDSFVSAPFFWSFVNNDQTIDDGTHAKALISGIIKASERYVEKFMPEKKFVINKKTVLSFLLGVIHIKMKHPQFVGAVKNQLNNREIIDPLSGFIAKLLFEKFESDKEKADSVIRHFAEIHWNEN